MWSFDTVLQAEEGGPAFFIEVPAEALAALGGRKRPPVEVTLNGYRYRTTIAVYAGRYYLPVRKEIREAAGLASGDAVAVTVAQDEAPRTVELPEDLRLALDANPAAFAAFGLLSYTHRKEYVAWILGARRAETRRRRIEKAVEAIKAGRTEP